MLIFIREILSRNSAEIFICLFSYMCFTVMTNTCYSVQKNEIALVHSHVCFNKNMRCVCAGVRAQSACQITSLFHVRQKKNTAYFSKRRTAEKKTSPFFIKFRTYSSHSRLCLHNKWIIRVIKAQLYVKLIKYFANSIPAFQSVHCIFALSGDNYTFMLKNIKILNIHKVCIIKSWWW